MLKKFFSGKKKKEEETDTPSRPVASKPSGKIVIKKRTPSKVPTSFVPSEVPFDPTEDQPISQEVGDFNPQKINESVAEPVVELHEPVQNAEIHHEEEFENGSSGSDPEALPQVQKISVDEQDFSGDITELEEQLGTSDAEREQLASDLDIAQKVIQDLRLQIGEKDSENSDLLSQKEKLTEEIAGLRKSESTDVVTDLNERIEREKAAVKKLTNERNLALDEVALLSKKCDELQQKVDNISTSTQDVSKEKKEAESEIQILQAMVSRLESEQNENESLFNEKLRELEDREQQKSAELKEAGEKVDRLEDEVQNLKVEKVALEKQAKLKSKKVADQKASLSSLTKEKDKLFKALKDMEAGNTSDQSLLEHSQSEIEGLKNKLKQKNAQIEELHAQIKEEQKLVSNAQNEVRKVEKDLAKKDKENADAAKDMEKLQSALNKEKKEKTDLKKKVTSLNEEVKKVEFFANQVDTLNAEIEKEHAVRDELNLKINELGTTNKDIIKENLQLGTELEKLQKKAGELEEKSEVAHGVKEELQKAKKDLEEKVSLLEKDLLQVRAEASEATGKLSELNKKYETLSKHSEKEANRAKAEYDKLSIALKEKAEISAKLDKQVKEMNAEITRLKTENADLGIEVAKVNKQLIQTATKLASASVTPPPATAPIKETTVAQAEIPTKAENDDKSSGDGRPESEYAEDEVLTINVSVIPQGDEFELEVPVDITGMDIISELIDAGVLNEEMNFAINVKRTGDAMGGDDSLKSMGMQQGDLIIIDTE